MKRDMKTHIRISGIISLLMLAATVPAFPQGAIRFSTKLAPNVDAPVSYSDGGCLVPVSKINGATAIPYGPYRFGGIYARLALYGGMAGTAEANLQLLGTSVFRTGVAAGYVTNQVLVLTNYPPGSSMVVQLRAWDAGVEATWENPPNSTYFCGKSAMITISSLGDTNSPSPLVDDISGLPMRGFDLPLPPCLECFFKPILYLKPTSTNTLVLSWESTNCACQLKVQTNPPAVGIGTNWTVVAGASNPMVIPIPPSNVNVFYRIGQSPYSQ